MLCGKHPIFAVNEGTMMISNASTVPKKIPSGINSLDTVIYGGFPAAPPVLLPCELEADEKNSNGSTVPGKVRYISFTKSGEDVLTELTLSSPEYHDTLRTYMEFTDFPRAYFARSSVPLSLPKDLS